jgi:hypothetical protein
LPYGEKNKKDTVNCYTFRVGKIKIYIILSFYIILYQQKKSAVG